MAKPTFVNIPTGTVVVALTLGVAVAIDESTAAAMVEDGTLFLCNTCPAYHLAKPIRAAMAAGGVLDLRTRTEELPADPELAAKLAEYGKAER